MNLINYCQYFTKDYFHAHFFGLTIDQLNFERDNITVKWVKIEI